MYIAIIISIVVILLLVIFGIGFYYSRSKTHVQELQIDAAVKTEAAVTAAQKAEVLKTEADKAAAVTTDAASAAAADAAQAAAQQAALEAQQAAIAAAAAKAAADEAARVEAAGKAAAASTQRSTFSYFNRGTGRDYVQGRSTTTAGVSGRGVLLGKFDTEEQCAAATLKDKNTKGYGYFAPYNGVWSGVCVGVLDKTDTYYPGVATHIYGIKRDPRDPAVVLRETAKNYAFKRAASPTTPAIFETGVAAIYGRQPDEGSCILACYDDPNCNAYTYHDTDAGDWGRVCVGTSEKTPISYMAGSSAHKSGRVL